jgi:hypothetical protein
MPDIELNTAENDLFKAVSRADRRRSHEALSIVNSEMSEWLKHKPVVTQIMKLVQENPGLFLLSNEADTLNAAHDYLSTAVKQYRNR